MESSSFKHLIKEKFDARTEYDKDNARHPTLAAQLVERSKLQRGWTVLDLACGTGLVTFLAAAEIGPTGSAVGVDISPGMIQQVGDLESCNYPDHSFDAILCSSAIFYINLKSVGKVLRSWLKPGGVLAYNTPEEPYTPLLTLMTKLLQERGHSNHRPDQPLSQTHSEQANIQLLQDAGFCSVKVNKTQGLLLERSVPVEEYVQKGFELVAVGFRPFFPALEDMTNAEQSALQSQFCTEAAVVGQSMLNSNGMVEDVHNDLWVTAFVGSDSSV